MSIRGGVVGVLILVSASGSARTLHSFQPGGRVLVDAHNAYPEGGFHRDRITRALATGLPVAIEQDLVWCRNGSGAFDVFVAHDTMCRGDEPTLREYFFDTVKPLVDAAILRGRTDDWPLLTLNLDFKMDPPELHQAVWNLLGEYLSWLTTAPRTATPALAAPLDVGPILVLTGEADAQEVSFHDAVAIGERLRLFGAVHDAPATAAASTATPTPLPATNYRRWWNHPWKVVEPEGQSTAGAWTPEDAARLSSIVVAAHTAGLWVRFYTLNGVEASVGAAQGWWPGYNFGTCDAAAARWRAALNAKVDFIATDQYEALASVVHAAARP